MAILLNHHYTGLSKFRQLVVNCIYENFLQYNSTINRERIVNHLNTLLFPDKVAEFIDTTTPEEIDEGAIGIMIKYKGEIYNLIQFEKFLLKIERLRKLYNIQNNGHREKN